MAEPRYAVVGTGRWGTRICAILEALGRNVLRLGRADVERGFGAGALAADIVWLAVPPAAQEALLERALAARKHVVVEKPWLASAQATARLDAAAKGLTVAVHFEYCFLDRLQEIPRGWREGERPVEFSGAFTTAGEDRLGIPAVQNLGSHLLAIHRRFVPMARLGSIEAAYRSPPCRLARFRSSDEEIVIDFTHNDEPLIQRFIASFEDHARKGLPFPLDLKFARRVNGE